MNLSIKSFVSFILILELLTGLVLAEDQYEQKRNEVMRPTQHGIRLTPEMARAGARIYVEKDLQKKLDLNPGQRKQMAEKIAEKACEMGARILGEIPYDEGFTKAQIEGQTLLEHGDSEAGRIIATIWEQIIERVFSDSLPEEVSKQQEAAT